MKSKLTIDKNGTKEWKLPSGDFHKEDGPALEYASGTKLWWINGKRHREDGPAIEYISGNKRWYINDREYTEQEYKYKIRSIKLKLLL
jgi:hypothetical protein